MKLDAAIDQYVSLKRAVGYDFLRGAYTLELFRRHHGDIKLNDIRSQSVRSFLYSKRSPHHFMHATYYPVAGFLRFCVARGYLPSLPLPAVIPKEPKAFIPYIYSEQEVRRILDAASNLNYLRSQIDLMTFRRIILLLYGTGIRIGEALSLTLKDVDVGHAMLSIKDSKFHKSRLVPIGNDLVQVISDQVTLRHHERVRGSSPLFASRRRSWIRRATFDCHFVRVRDSAGVHRETSSRYQPRVHDFRHTFAVRRVVSWYREGANLEIMLPRLATYLGHINLSGTQRYLTLTGELLSEASSRFERYAMGEHHA